MHLRHSIYIQAECYINGPPISMVYCRPEVLEMERVALLLLICVKDEM